MAGLLLTIGAVGTPIPGAAGRAGSGVVVAADASSPALSASGGSLAFVSSSTGLVPRDTNGVADVFVKNLATGRTVRASVGPSGRQADGPSSEPALSAGGRYLVFTSLASNLVAGDTNGVSDVFIRDLWRGRTSRVSVSGAGAQGDAPSESPTVSGTGRFVAFESLARLTPSDTDEWVNDETTPDIFVRDLVTGRNTLMSPPSPVEGWNPEFTRATGGHDPWISRDGRYVGFVTLLMSGQNGWGITARRDRWTGALDVPCGDADTEGFCLDPVVLSGNGRALTYVNLASGAPRAGFVAYFDGRPAWLFQADDVWEAALSGDGDTVAFATRDQDGDVTPGLYVAEREGAPTPELVAYGATDPTLSANACRLGYVLDGAVRFLDRCP